MKEKPIWAYPAAIVLILVLVFIQKAYFSHPTMV